MASAWTKVATVLSKNPLHVAYVKNWLEKYAGGNIAKTDLDEVFANLYNSYYYWIHDRGFAFPVVLDGGAFNADSTRLRNEISGQTGYVQSVVNQFIYAMVTGYRQSKLSAEFAFPRNNSEWVAGTKTGTTTTTTTTKEPSKTDGITWIPQAWTNPAEPKKDGSILTYGILAALAAGVYFYSKKKGR